MVYGSLKVVMTFTETIPIKSETAEQYEETVGFGNVDFETSYFTETLICSSVDITYEESFKTRIIANLMRAIFGETMTKVKGIVVPIKKKLEELKKQIEEITADDIEELKRRIEEIEEEDA